RAAAGSGGAGRRAGAAARRPHAARAHPRGGGTASPPRVRRRRQLRGLARVVPERGCCAMIRPASPQVAYVMKGFPRASEPFISHEVRLLEASGMSLRLFALKGLSEEKSHPH